VLHTKLFVCRIEHKKCDRRKGEKRKMTIEKIYDDGILAEIDPGSDTPRLREYLAHIEKCGPAKTWSGLVDLHITEEDFEKGPCYLSIDGGAIKVMIRTRIPDSKGCGEFGWAYRPRLGDAFFDYSGCPEWLREKFVQHWDFWARVMVDHYTEKDAARSSGHRMAGFFD